MTFGRAFSYAEFVVNLYQVLRSIFVYLYISGVERMPGHGRRYMVNRRVLVKDVRRSGRNTFRG